MPFNEHLLEVLPSVKAGSKTERRTSQALFGLGEHSIEHSSLLGSFGLLVQIDENVSGLVLLS